MASGTTIDLYPSPIEHDLTVRALAELVPIAGRPIVPGDDWSQDFRCVKADGTPENLTGATVVLTVRRRAPGSATLFDRDTAVDLAGGSGKQIVLSATPTDGKFTARFGPGDETTLNGALGLSEFDVRVRFTAGGTRVETRALGVFEIVPTPSPNGQIP